MRRIFLLTLVATMALTAVFYTSCKKPHHDTHPTPSNNRIYSYTKFSTNTNPGSSAVNETFTFYYDNIKRLSQIVYSSNDQAKLLIGRGDMNIFFYYSNDTIYKVYTAVKSSVVLERDTFIVNSAGLITTAYVPGEMDNFGYFGKLIANNSKTVSDSGTYITGGATYTSDNGDLLHHVYDGSLSAQFPDMGINFNPFPHVDNLIPPLTVTWTDFGSSTVTTTHTTSGYTDVLNGYSSGAQVMVQAVDGNGVVAFDTLYWPGGLWPKESYFVYPDLYNRPGDYMQIESFTNYAVNIYQNAHLIKYINEDKGPQTVVNYTIDADSKITQTYVTKTVSPVEVYTTIYKFQYETF